MVIDTDLHDADIDMHDITQRFRKQLVAAQTGQVTAEYSAAGPLVQLLETRNETKGETLNFIKL